MAAVGIVFANAGCSIATLMVGNAVVGPDGRAIVEGYAHRRPMFPFLEDVPRVEVNFSTGSKPLGAARTDESGTGRLPTAFGPEDRVVVAEATIDGKALRATAEVFHWQPEKVILVVDIDDTICDLKIRRLLGPAPTLDPIEHSVETLTRLAGRFHVVYVTARPRRVLEGTRDWLALHAFPPGPVITSEGVTKLVDIAADKVKNISALKRGWPAVLIGIGNKASDAEAYGRCGLLTIIVRPEQEKEHRDHAIFMPSWSAIDEFFQANVETLADARAVREVLAGTRALKLRVLEFPDGEAGAGEAGGGSK